MNTRDKNKRRNGFTLIEALMALVILTMAVAGILLPFVSGATVRSVGNRRTLAAKLSTDLMEDIVNTSFSSIVATYNGYSEAQGAVKDLNGVVFTDTAYANFSRSATCTLVYVDQQPGTDPAIFITAIVSVSYLGQEIASVTRLIGDNDEDTIFKSWTFGS
ncbi:MAG: prepilin-type N-terminal cleavage/methylation domain-containing protein [Planctomycetes bacterium]|nr:prepilin-type N-terminal cleavage/methylation domain-containing protein [Planctomycetota bacterium]